MTMAPQLRFEVCWEGRLTHVGDFGGALELGRQQAIDEPLFEVRPDGGRSRVAVAGLDELYVSRRHALVEPLADGRLRVANVSSANTIRLEDGALPPGANRELRIPCHFVLGFHEVRIRQAEANPTQTDPAELRTLPRPTPPGALSGVIPHGGKGSVGQASGPPTSPSLSALPLAALDDQASISLVAWLQAVASVLQSAATNEDFFDRAASAVVELVAMDSGRVLVYDAGQWKTVAEKAGRGFEGGALDWQASRGILASMRAKKQTTWREAGGGEGSMRESLINVEAVVVSPILDRAGEVIGALYGDRLFGSRSGRGAQISRPDAMLMETLASGVAAGLARLEQEKAVLAARVQFEQFFSAELARELTLHPDLIEGRDTEVTVLFCDIRGFSAVAERLGPAGTMEWINDVFGALSECVLRHQGVLVDYVGDELLAMWGAPVDQPDHARLACRAAIDMWQTLPEINERWSPRLETLTRVGIGINTGPARVGNTGSQRKFKYGPLGNTVNLGSRVQGATKYLKTGMLLTAQTERLLDDSFATRRLCQARVVNIAEPVALYELRPQSDAGWQELRARYGEALGEFERRHFSKATAILGQLLDSYPGDGPSIVLLSRSATLLADELASRGTPFDPVWDLPGK
jgi:adenylate cyclase